MTARWPEIDPDSYSEDERVIADYEPPHGYQTEVHEDCGYVWSVHTNRDPRSVMPFGCPPDEWTAIERWGRAS